ncbi:unnamed protein product [Mytilus coruscus]|uniref:Mab-21-like HhH/H2TH-like domain-containing protein n=1 Tax=Mytilus coruscus TaxID=42192 RepID=A0A6J8EWA6_MYTCO|nr:unnamed protein product [Mytilus coruscus]
MSSVDENDSIWLFEILDCIGVRDEHRKACQRESITFEILQTFNNTDPISIYNFESWSEGTVTPEEIDLEWRISLSLQERKLMFNLTDVQYKCYVVLKMLNQNNLNLDCLTSFHWKTCLFYVIENSKSSVWEKKQLCHCIKMCVKQMLKWVKLGVCPNYFIPEDNLFDGRLHNSWRLQSEKKLEELIDEGFDCFLRVQTSNICDFVKLRGSLEKSLQLQAKSKQVIKEVLYSKKMLM